jgi:drug/metabolite transporter (DMT)-like permease
MGPDEDVERRTTAVWAAYVTVCIVWGTTYLSIRIVNQTLPPLLAASARFVIAGGLMYAFTIRRGDREGDRPGPRQWVAAAIVGLALLLGGNGAVVWAERTVPSGLVALIIALIPLWMALIDSILGRRPRPSVAVGLLIGFAGAALLVGGSAGGHVPLLGMLFAVGATVSWASGSLYARNAPLPSRPFVGIAMEMLCGGVGLFVAGVLAGDLGRIHPGRISVASVVALAYLIVFGSWLGFASYVWLLRNARTSFVSTYAFVNPVVAVFLGWLVLGESISLRTVVAGAMVLAAVAITVTSRAERPPPEATSGGELPDEPGHLGERDLPLERASDPQNHGLAERRGGDLQPDR